MKPYKLIKIYDYEISIYREFIPKFQKYTYSYLIVSEHSTMGNYSIDMIGNITYSTLDEILKKEFKMTKIPKETKRL